AYPPHLLLVDGGKGQLSAAVKILKELNLEDRIPVAAIAKKYEEVYVPWNPDPIRIPRDSEALYLLQRIRDESHRFAVNYHRQLRNKQMKKSILDEISGLGPVRKQKLVQHFGSIEKIRKAELDDFTKLTWLPKSVAKEVFEKCSGKISDGT
ncbi:MAG TPA: excinuclease ABC subunit C, partial [Acidimicrobiales bacterium]|nr:excinuclease ABC subunit C [Acidimicrobiales bacterium]